MREVLCQGVSQREHRQPWRWINELHCTERARLGDTYDALLCLQEITANQQPNTTNGRHVFCPTFELGKASHAFWMHATLCEIAYP